MPPLYGLEDYGSCLVPADGTYCLLRVDLFAQPTNELIGLIHEYSKNTIKHYNHTYLQRGVCVTTTCQSHIKNNSIQTTEGLTKVLEGCLNETIFSDYGLEANLTELYYCERKGQHIEIDMGDWIVLGIFVVIVLVNCIGTLYDIIITRMLYENAYYQLIFNGLVVVQVFFVISGFLLVYNLETYAEKNHVGWMLAPKIWIMRWWRLTPAYALVLAFMTTWLRHLGSGPLWRMFVSDSVVGDCRQYWWAHLLYINNYIAGGRYCALHTWHIATDTQLFCVGLLVYFTTRHGGRYVVMGLLIVLGVVLPAAHVWMWDLDGLVLVTPDIKFVSKICIALAWFIIPSIGALFYSGSMFYGDGQRLPLGVRMAFAGLQRLVIGVLVAFGVLGLTMRFNTILRNFFESRAWVVPSRLSYSVYLLHLFIIYTYIGIKTQMGHASTFNMTIVHFGVMVLTFMVALPFCLLVEAPLMRLVKSGGGAPPREELEQTKF
ncbi:Uncharacterized protein OBRU01_15545 [Operophtera brumata]|uniref:Acyltransferase 3 domain-containing protein n=1 Tax=Operophtera brumata TaxID=104452 RepID=A0A0L7L4N3_OPEBR|nr:Uncharacterized protein OBRU01_15545 [Operophtera brumata]